MLSFIILIFLIVLNGLFVMAEIALVSAREKQAGGHVGEGRPPGKSCSQTGRKAGILFIYCTNRHTLVAILTGFYSGEKFGSYLKPYIEMIPQLKRYSNSISTTIVIIIVTFLTIIFGELIPKGLA